jgi:hypothetical protein
MKTFTLALCCILLSAMAEAQRNIVTGKIVLQNNDTLTGQIDEREWAVSPEYVEFRKQAADDWATYTSKDIKAFITPDDIYEVFTVSVSLNPIKMQYAWTDSKLKWEVRTVFAQLLVKGPPALYLYEDQKPHFLVRKDGGVPEELQYLVFEGPSRSGNAGVNDAGNTIMDVKIYQQQLLGYATEAQYEMLEKKVANLKYDKAEMVKIFSWLSGDEKMAANKRNFKKVTWLYGGAGVSHSTLSFREFGGRAIIDDSRFTTSTMPGFVAGIKTYLDAKLRKNNLQFEVGYSSNRHLGTGPVLGITRYEYEFKSGHLAFRVLYNQFFARTGNLGVYAGFGPSLQLLVNPDFKEWEVTTVGGTETRVQTKEGSGSSKWLTFNLQVGCEIAERFDVRACMNIGGSYARATNAKSNPKFIGLLFSYHFLRL